MLSYTKARWICYTQTLSHTTDSRDMVGLENLNLTCAYVIMSIFPLHRLSICKCQCSKSPANKSSVSVIDWDVFVFSVFKFLARDLKLTSRFQIEPRLQEEVARAPAVGGQASRRLPRPQTARLLRPGGRSAILLAGGQSRVDFL